MAVSARAKPGRPSRAAAKALIDATLAMHAEGVPLMRRIVPRNDAPRFWDRYPDGGFEGAPSGSSAFYHIHPPSERRAGEHGHFHLFLPRHAMPAGTRPIAERPHMGIEVPGAQIVHVAALSVATSGVPTALFTVNRWVTDDIVYPADALLAALDAFDLTGAAGDPLVCRWLTAAAALMRPALVPLLAARDAAFRPDQSEDRGVEILSYNAIDLQSLLDAALV